MQVFNTAMNIDKPQARIKKFPADTLDTKEKE